MRLAIFLKILVLALINYGEIFAGATQPSVNGSISGILIDSVSAEPIEFATIALLEKGESHSVKGTMTDSKGAFVLQEIPKGNYELAFSYIGFKTKRITDLTISDSSSLVNIGAVKLSPSATQLQEVIVDALRPTITQEADRIVVNVEGSVMAAGSTAFDVIAKSPGVFIDQNGNVQLNGRSGVTIMIDGKLTYLSSTELRAMLESMSAENIRNIEIISNPSAKYDAEGVSGILNINFKKNVMQGINGNINAGYTYNGKQHGYSSGLSIYHRSGKWNSFLNLNMARRVGGREATFTRVFYAEDHTTYFDQEASGNYEVEGPPYARFGTDYSFNDKHSIGVKGRFITNSLESDFLTDTYIGNTPGQPEQYIDANNYTSNTYTNYMANANYTGKPDTLGTLISADLDFVKIRNKGESNFYNYYSDLNSEEPAVQDFLFSETPNHFDIYSAKIDYTKALSKDQKLEVGAKASQVFSDNDSRFYFNNGALLLDLNRSNHFIYDESILAAYANWNSKLNDRYTLQAGLRAEHTQSKGESLTTGQVTKRDYLNFFPSAFLQQKVNDNYEINYSYSRRLQRPYYENMNPFISYRDPYTYVQGNPYLRPAYTNAFGITHTFKKTYSLALNYSITKDVISELPILDVENTTTIYTTGNVDDSKDLNLRLMAPLRIMKNWETNNTFYISYNEYTMMANDQKLINEQIFYMLQSSHTIVLPYKFKMEVNAAYRGPAASGLYIIKSMYWVHMGLKKSLLNDKLDISLNANDIFKGYRLRFTTDIAGNVNEFDQYFRNRTIGLTLRYNFSKGLKVIERSRSGSLEELNRAGG